MKKTSLIAVCIICITCIFCSAFVIHAQNENNTNGYLNPLYENENEKPLERYTTDGGYTSIFRTIACIGDSLASGEFEAKQDDGQTITYHDMFEYSWGQFMGRMCSSKVYNFSKGGMTAQAYCTTFAQEKGYWDSQYAAQAYIIALGVNDLAYFDLGSKKDVNLSDWKQNTKNYAGYYAQIIQRYKEIQPKAKFFLVTMPSFGKNDTKSKSQTALMYDFAEMFDNTYVIDINQYGPEYDAKFKEKYFLGSHMNAMGYEFTAEMFCSYIDYIIRHNWDDFREVQFIGTNLHG